MQNILDYLREHKLELLIGVVVVPLVMTLALAELVMSIRVMFGALLVGFVLLVLFSGRLGRRARGYLGEDVAFSLPRRGLILTIGKQRDTALLALRKQNVQWVGLLCTSASEADAKALIADLKLDKTYCRVHVVDGFNAKEVSEATLQLMAWFKSLGIGKAEMAVDVTGGLTTMSVGAFAAAESQRVDTQYVRSDFDAQNKPMPTTQKGVFVVRYTPLP